MDPKKLSGLDPKLRETYERIMGTSSPSNQPPTPLPTIPNTPVEPIQKQPQPQIQTTIPQATPISGFIKEPPAQTPTPKEELPQLSPIMETQTVQEAPLSQNLNMNTPQEDFTKSPFSTVSNNSLVNPNPSPDEVTGSHSINQPLKQKKKNKLLPVLLLVGVIIFFVVYAVVWAKVFSLF